MDTRQEWVKSEREALAYLQHFTTELRTPNIDCPLPSYKKNK